MTPPIQLAYVAHRRKKPALKKRASLLLGLAIVLGLLLLLTMASCTDAGAQEPQPTAQEQRLARGATQACEGLTPVFENGSLSCLKEIP